MAKSDDAGSALSRRSVLAGASMQAATWAIGLPIWPVGETAAAAAAPMLQIDIDKTIDQWLPATPGQARAMAARVVASCLSIAQTSAITIKQLAALERAIAEGARQLSELEDRKRTVIAQLRSGFYCSRCKRSKIEIEAQEKEDFETHLRRVNGQKIPAPESLVREKAAEFDAQIDKLKKEQGLRVKNRDKNREFNDSLQQQFREGVLFWRTAILMEYGLLETQFKKKNELEENGLAAVKNLLRQLQTQELKLVQNLDGRDPKALVRLQQNQEEQNLASEKIALMEKRIAARKRNYEDSRRVLENNRDREMNALTEAASEISGTQHYRMSAIPSVTVSFSGWTIAVSNEHAGARFKFNKVLTSGVDEKFDREGHYAETVAYIELFGKVRIFAGQRTDFTLEGVNTYSVGGISTGPKPNPDPFDDEKKPDESWKIELPRP